MYKHKPAHYFKRVTSSKYENKAPFCIYRYLVDKKDKLVKEVYLLTKIANKFKKWCEYLCEQIMPSYTALFRILPSILNWRTVQEAAVEHTLIEMKCWQESATGAQVPPRGSY